jgi:hypothetical protein
MASSDVTGALGYTPLHSSGTPTTGGLAYFSAATTLASTVGLTVTPTASAVPVSDGGGTLNSWVTGSTQKAVYTYTDGPVYPAIDSTWHNVAAHTFTTAAVSVIRIHVEAIFADGYSNARTCGVSILADNGGTASTLRSPGMFINVASASSGLGAIVASSYLIGSAVVDAQVSLSAGTTTVAVALFAPAGGYNCYVPAGLLTTIVQVF